MLVGDQPRRALVGASVFVAALLVAAAGARAAPFPSQVSFSVPGLFPTFGSKIEDYVVRCNDAPVTVTAHASEGWQVSIANHPFRTGDFSETVQLSSGRAFQVTAQETGDPQLSRYYVRCLPNSFPAYGFTRSGSASPKFFAASRNDSRYAMIFDNHGVPLWWVHTLCWNVRVLPSGNALWFNGSLKRFEVHRLDGSLVRALKPVGQPANGHDLRFVDNGDALVGAYVEQSRVDTSPYGSSDATVKNAELQQVTPGGELVWDWKSQDHISLAQTGRWWNTAPLTTQPYDLVHWNSIEPAGNSVIASFRHLDAVYKIRTDTGAIVWKLGGTHIPRSLSVIGDPRAYTFGGQHDARLLPDGTLTVFDNRTDLPQPPRAVRFRIDQQAGTATLLESIIDPEVPASYGLGSARRLGNGDWLIDWGSARNHPIGGYHPDGQRTFRLTFNRASYRAEPVPPGVVTAKDLRAGMQAMCSSGCG